MTAMILEHAENRLRMCHSLVRFVLFAALLILLSHAISALIHAASGVSSSESLGTALRSFGVQNSFVLAVLIAPAVETVIFQSLPMELTQRIWPKHRVIGVVASGILFGSMHGYSVGYMLGAALLGSILAIAYLVQAYPGGMPFLFVSGLHAVHNLVFWAQVHFAA